VLVSSLWIPPLAAPDPYEARPADQGRAYVNRQYKRMMRKEQQRRAAAPRPQVKAPGAPARERTRPRQFAKEVIAELQKVAWPTRQEVVSYSVVVLVSVVVIAAIIFVMDYVFTKAVLALFGVEV
jgi:preprotein translocase subunit SecE